MTNVYAIVYAQSMSRSHRRQPQKCPPHVRALAEEYWLARESYEAALEATCCGHLGGQEEREYRETHPGPLFKDLLIDHYAAWRRDHMPLAA